jgi:ribose transport system substrate-binding protein
MGEIGVQTILKLLNGEQVPNFIDTGVVLATKDNIDHPSVQNVLY